MKQQYYRLKPQFRDFVQNVKHNNNPLKLNISYYDYIELTDTVRFFYEKIGTPCQNHELENEYDCDEEEISKINLEVANE